MIDVIILVGGFGTRLQKIIHDMPKPLAPIFGIPFLDYLFKQLETWTFIDQVILAIGYRGEKIKAHYSSNRWRFPIQFSEEDVPLGTGGALKKALQFTCHQSVFVMNGDSYFEIDFKKMLESHQQNQAGITLACRYVEDIARYGEVCFDISDFRITQFCEKKGLSFKGWINGGIYLIERELINTIDSTVFSLEYDFFPQLLSNKRVFAYPCSGKFCDIGTEESYRQAAEVFKR